MPALQKTHWSITQVLSLLILSLYIWALFLFSDFAGLCKITLPFGVFLGILSVLISYLLLYSLRKLANIRFASFHESLCKNQWLTIGSIFLITLFFLYDLFCRPVSGRSW